MAEQNVLFLCTGNSARSQIAEAFLRKYAGDRFNVYSAGLEPKGIHPLTIQVMDEIGMDIRGQTSDHVNSLAGLRYYSYIITVCAHADANCPSGILALGNQKLHWGFDDPAAMEGTEEEKLAKFREVRDLMDEKIRAWLGEIEVAKA